MIALMAVAAFALVGVLVWESPLVREKRRQRQARRVQAVLAALRQHPTGIYGYDLHKASGLWPGSLYPLLVRMEDDGIVHSWWGEPVFEGGPRRRYYALTESIGGDGDA